MNKRLFKTLLTSAVVLGSVAAPVAAFAQDYDSLIGQSESQIENLSAAQAQLYAQLASSYAKLQEVQAQATTLQGNIQENDAAIASLQAEIKDLEVAIGKRESLLADQARAVQATGGAENYVNVVASSKSVSDFVGRVDVVKKMVSANKTLLGQQKADKEAVETKKSAVETTKADNVAKHVQLEALKGALTEEQANNEAVYNQLTSDLSLAQNAREALIAEKAAYQQRQAEIAAAQQAAAEQAAAEAQAQALAQQQAQAEAAAQEQAAQEQATRESQLAEQPAPAAEEAKPAAPTTEAEATSQAEATESQAPEASASETPAAEESTATETPSTQEEASTTPAPQPAQEAPAAEEEPEAPAATTEEEPEAPAAEAPAASTYGDVLSTAAKYVGTPYVWGGKSPSGFDCSGFVQYVFKEAYGIDVGSWTVPQESAGTRISVSEAQAGDLYFWGDAGSTYHVAIATGGGNFIHASQPGTPLGYNNIQNFTPQFAVRVR
ncbi:NlpC/P60 family protein [uncultured Abiotrophia sp.]|uniref:C40 family peptidase n=1 Tax=uncultured Abiotrophia sp. TaxID=316094 RepID=UPI0026377C75|nr:NlpC/P60 family protein [uncultured Abiotrophia sp.]